METTDILHGYTEIGGYLRMSYDQAKHRASLGEIPTFKLGRSVCSRRSTLDAWLVEQERKGQRQPEPETA